jgi:RNA-directed DNA polymerase
VKNGYVNKNRYRVNYVRYADDFIVTANSKEFLEEKIIPVIREFLRVRGLSLSEEKTRIVTIREGFDFLGQNVRKYKGKLFIKPSKANIKSVKQKIGNIIRKNKTSSQDVLIKQLNPVIRGWAYYHRHVVAKDTFISLDHYIYWRLWSWSRRRHTRKSAAWIMKRYFHATGKVQWVFCCIKPLAILLKAQSISIRRHVKTMGTANPYDPLWFEYFERRTGRLNKPSQIKLDLGV